MNLAKLLVIFSLVATTGFGQDKVFEFISKEGKVSLLTNTGLIPRNKTTKFVVNSISGMSVNSIQIVAVNGSIVHNGPELQVNVANESLIYLLVLVDDEETKSLKYYDFIGLPIATTPYPFIVVYADNVPVNPQRGVQGNTDNLSMKIMFDKLQGSCKDVFVTQIAATFTDRQREVGLARKQGDVVAVKSLLSRGASPHLQIKVKAEAMGCTTSLGVLKTINPKIKRTFTYGVTASNLDKDIQQIITHLNSQKAERAEISKVSNN